MSYLIEQMSSAGPVQARKMFGEYGVFLHGKMVALVCDDQLFVKPTPGGRSWVGECPEASPYPGAKPCLLITGDRCDDGEWLSGLIAISARELPEPKPKAPRKAKAAKPKP